MVSTPEGDYAPYDRIVTKGPFIHKIQVKSATHSRNKVYKWTLRGGFNKKKQHSLEDISFYIFSAVPDNLFVIVPHDLIIGKQTLSMNTSKDTVEHSKYYMFIDAWGLLENKGYNDVAQ